MSILEHAAITGATASATGVVVARILAGRWLKRAIRAVAELHRIAALLDTSEPGGLTDIEDAVRDMRERRQGG